MLVVPSASDIVRAARSAPDDVDRSPVGRPWRRARRLKRRLAVRMALVVAIALFLLAAPLVTEVDPNKQNVLARLQPAGAVLADGRIALLGTDQLGRDMYARILYGGQISLLISVSGVLLAAGIGVSLGLVSGYYGRYADAVVIRLVDIQLGFPGLLLAITLAAALGPGVLNVVIALGIARWTTYARIVRSSSSPSRTRSTCTRRAQSAPRADASCSATSCPIRCRRSRSSRPRTSGR